MNKISLSFLLLFGLSSFPHSVLACTCSYAGAFPEFSAKYSTIVRAKILSYGEELSPSSGRYFDMVVEVTEVVKGAYPNQTITLIGDSGMSCLNPISSSKFPIDSEHFITLSNTQKKQALLGCGESSIRARRSILQLLRLSVQKEEATEPLTAHNNQINKEASYAGSYS